MEQGFSNKHGLTCGLECLHLYVKLPRNATATRCQKFTSCKWPVKVQKLNLLQGKIDGVDLEKSPAYIAKHLPTIVRQQNITTATVNG